mgnify:CR=1 FL=1
MLIRKMFRDIRFNISQYITIFLMIVIGTMAFTGIKSYMLGMERSADLYYENNNLQELDAFGLLTDKDIDALKEYNHVNDIDGKLTLISSASISNYGSSKAEVNFIKENDVSKFYVRDGIDFDVDKDGIWIDAYYANENDIKVGDILEFTYEKYTFKKEVLGIIYIPDKVYAVKDESEIFPDHSEFALVYLSIKELPKELLVDMIASSMKLPTEVVEQQVNSEDINYYTSAMIDIDSSDNKKSVKSEIEKYEAVNAVVDIKDEFSYMGYQSEIDEGKSYIGIFSGLFIFIALLSVITTMTRVIKKERTEIGTLKALGFTNTKVMLHYLSYGILISVLGCIVGVGLGYLWFGNFFLSMEMAYFEMPVYRGYIDLSSLYISLVIIGGVCITTYLCTHKVLKLNAAETLRVERPKVKSGSLDITNNKFFNKLPFSTRWNIRDIIRNIPRTLMGIAGMTGCMILILAALGMKDTIGEFINIQFNKLYNYEYRFNLSESITEDELNSLIDKYGNHTTKTYPIEIDLGNGFESNTVTIDNSDGYVRYLDENNKFMELSDDGVYITRKLAELNDLEVGDTITFHIYGSKEDNEEKIIGLTTNPQNQNIQMTAKYAEKIGIDYLPDSLYTDEDVSKIDLPEGVTSIQDINSLLDGVESMLSTMNEMIVIIIIFACLLGAVIIYNMGILSFSEKNYQFATLKVLGFKDSKIAHIFIEQNIIIAVIAILLGLPSGYVVLDYIFKNAIGDSYDFAATIRTISYVMASIGTFLVSYLISLLLSRKIRKIDMVTSLKGNE